MNYSATRADESPLYAYIAKEFNARGTPLRKKLGTKEYGGAVADDLGLARAAQLLKSNTPDVFGNTELPERFVLKYAHGWSSRGVMLLERQSEQRSFFEHLSQRRLSADDVVERQRQVAHSFANKPDEWIVEEWLTPATPGSVPFDYKFYTFRTLVALVVQIDRNVQPVKVALFDGEFRPLRPGIDYVMTGSAQYGQHLIPKHALQMLRWAAVLSSHTDAPFVSVDLFDTPSGPTFGEFTFSPGAMHKRMWALSDHVVEMLDQHFANGAAKHGDWPWVPQQAGKSIDSNSLMAFDIAQLREVEDFPFDLYSNWSRYLYNGGRRGALRTSEFFRDRARGKDESPMQDLLITLASRWSSIRTYGLAVEGEG